MADGIYEATKVHMDKTIANLANEFASLRAGRANPTLVQNISVEYYGTTMPINQIGNISVPEPRILVITPWDAKAIPAIEKAIQKSEELGINPSNDGHVIRLVFPELTEERRKELSKTIDKKAEEAKVAIRAIRRDANDQIKKDKKANLLTEDDQKKLENDIQKLTEDYTKKIDGMAADKKKEIMKV